MDNKNEMARMHETILNQPSMDETVKFNQGIPRKTGFAIEPAYWNRA